MIVEWITYFTAEYLLEKVLLLIFFLALSRLKWIKELLLLVKLTFSMLKI